MCKYIPEFGVEDFSSIARNFVAMWRYKVKNYNEKRMRFCVINDIWV